MCSEPNQHNFCTVGQLIGHSHLFPLVYLVVQLPHMYGTEAVTRMATACSSDVTNAGVKHDQIQGATQDCL